MDNGNNGNVGDNKAGSVRCEHLREGRAIYLRNDGLLPPALFVEVPAGTAIILTNQTIYLKCIQCYLRTQPPKLTLEPLHPPK